jgi:hypothetical protein
MKEGSPSRIFLGIIVIIVFPAAYRDIPKVNPLGSLFHLPTFISISKQCFLLGGKLSKLSKKSGPATCKLRFQG